ncbi:lipopolysaccharide biosynthesis protein [Deinococcus radiopugnans]|nr:oligosaccharide flippase family protein [Deinococcus radiopugnans]MBB6017771.1 O-antigen/teichoic acid export membrane protein [Deinococcus radiopugnans ATCC 19172]
MNYRKKILTLMSGTIVAQSVPLIVTPILTRLYSPSEFGTLALFISIITVFGSVINLRYETAIMNPIDDDDALNVAAGGVVIALLLSIALALLLLVSWEQFLELLNATSLKWWIFLAPPIVFLIGVFNVLNFYNTRLENYRAISDANAIKSISGAVVQVILGFLNFGSFGLILGQFTMQIVSSHTLLSHAVKNQNIKSITFKRIVEQITKYKDFALYLMPATLANVLGFNIVNILFSSFFGVASLGFLSMTTRLLGLPTQIIGSSVGQVFYQEATVVKNAGKNIVAIFSSTVRRLFMIGIIPFSIMFLLAPVLFSLVFGKEWYIAGIYLRILSPMMFIRFITAPITFVPNIVEKPKPYLLWQIGFMITSIASILIAYYLNMGSFYAITFYGMQGVIQYVILLILCYRLIVGNLHKT